MIGNQILYTAANEERRPINGLHGRDGYRVIAISTDLAGETKLLEYLDNWHYPIGIIHHGTLSQHPFKSLLFFKNWVIYTTCIISTISHDGRPDQLFTQHIVITKEQFLKLDNDTRYLDPYFKEYFHDTRYAPPIAIQKGVKAPTKIHHKWKEVTDALKEGRSVGIESKHIPDMQGMIAELPIEDRLIPWCNMMYEPDRQWEFKFFCGEDGFEWKLRKKRNWRFFDLTF